MNDRKPIINCKFTRMKKENNEWKNIKINTFKDILEDLVNYNNELEDTIIDLQNEVRKWKEYNKDEEIEKYKQQVSGLIKHSIYILDSSQEKKMKEFRHKHYEKHNVERYSIICEPNHIFTSIKIRCEICGEELDLTRM